MFDSINPLPNPPMGGCWKGDQLQFGLIAVDAINVSYCFYAYSPTHHGEHRSLLTRIQLDSEFRSGQVWGWEVQLSHKIDSDLLYVIEVEKEDGSKHFVFDPYARESIGGEQWGNPLGLDIDPRDYKLRISSRPHGVAFHGLRRMAVLRQFQTQTPQTKRPERPNHALKDSIVYECHLRGMTQSASSPAQDSSIKGTYRGLVECLPHLKELGITAIELLPIFDFDENENPFSNPETGQPLLNYWGYSTLNFFAPKQNYASDLEQPISEFKQMVDQCHEAGIEVWLDVVYNHTAEFGEGGPKDHFKILGENQYYIMEECGIHTNYSGCGNTVQCAHPITRKLIRESLYYWANEMGVDGFRFDLATILDRNKDGTLNGFPQFLWELRNDPGLKHIKLISEPWDAAGGYQLGNAAFHADWAEWNDRYRDSVRRAVKGDLSMMAELKQAILGSPDVYGSKEKSRLCSINFITAHDGMTMMDLVSYNQKHNLGNGEGNRDGNNSEHSNNCGVEGPSDDPAILQIRNQKIRLFHGLLHVSNGIPMMIAGDEFGRTQQGNNNAYCQDSELSWVDWDLLEKNKSQFEFVKRMIALRKNHADFMFSEKSEYQWLNDAGEQEDGSSFVRTLHWEIKNSDYPNVVMRVLINCFDQPVEFRLTNEISWKVLVDSDKEPLEYVYPDYGSTWLESFSIQVLRGLQA